MNFLSIFAAIILVGVVALYVKYAQFKKRRTVRIPGITVVKGTNTDPEFIKSLSKTAATCGQKMLIVENAFGSSVMVTHPDTAKEVLKNDEMFPKGSFTISLFGRMLDESLVAANDDLWKHQRTVMSPAFHFDYIKGMVPMFIEKTEELLSKLPVGKVEVTHFLYHFTVDVLGLAAFGVDFHSLTEGERSEYYEAYKELVTHSRQLGKSAVNLLKEYLPLPATFKLYAAKDKLVAMTDDLIKKRRESGEKKYLLDMMLDANPSLSKKQLETNTFLFFIAGHETTASALNWAFYLLAKHPDIQERVRDEVDKVLGGKIVEADQLKDLLYLDMFIKEVMRYGTPIPLLASRAANQDIYLDNHFLPKGTRVGLAIHAIHHNPEFWPNPDVFDPERFNPAKIGKQHPFAFLPFSLGKRVCIGNNFSLMEQKVFLSMLLQRYVVSNGEDPNKPFALDPASIAFTPAEVTVILSPRKPL